MDVEELLKELITIRSCFNEPPYERDVASYLEGHLQRLGFDTQLQHAQAVQRDGIVYERCNVLAEKGQSDCALLVYGHMDTVPPARGWTLDPWTPTQRGDRLYGLGARDMKAGLAALLAAAEVVEPNGYTLKMAFLVDEEDLSRGAAQLVGSYWTSDVALAMTPESATAEEETQGTNVITIGRRGRVTIQVDVAGKSAHGGQPEKGISALYRAAHIAIALEAAVEHGGLPMQVHPDMGRGSLSIRSFYSSAQGLSVPDTATLLIDRHLVPPETPEQVCRDMADMVEHLFESGALIRYDEYPITVTIAARETPYYMPYLVPQTHPYLQHVERVVSECLPGVVAQYSYAKSVADENYFGAPQSHGGLGVPVIVVGPHGGPIHAPDEWVSRQSLRELVDIYRVIFRRFQTWL